MTCKHYFIKNYFGGMAAHAFTPSTQEEEQVNLCILSPAQL